MKKFTTKMIGSGTRDDPFRVNLPTYTMFGEPDYVTMTCDVLVPDDELNKTGTRPDKQKIRQKYRRQPKWDRPDVGDDV